MKLFLLAVLNLFISQVMAQPYVDPFHIRYTYGIKTAHGTGTPFNHLYIGPDFPLKLRKNKIFVFSPVFEQWNIDSATNKSYLPQVNGLALAMSAIIPIDQKQWTLTVSAIPRLSGEELEFQNSFQLGGVLLTTYKKRENLKYKFGVYVNSEFFGAFIIPLVGIDWHIDDRNNLFGVLPGRLTFEHRLNQHFYTGGTFRAITNSYRLKNETYLRIDDNQLSTYLDCYIHRHLVITGETGYGILRQLRTGRETNKNYLLEYNWADGLFFRIAASYRIRL